VFPATRGGADFRRNVTTDTEVRGQKIKAGDKVTIW
jgi:cytochrome P450